MEISLAAEPIFHIGSFPVTNTLLVSWAIILFLTIVTLFIKSRLKEIPKGVQNIAETVVEGALKFMDDIVGDRKLTTKFFPVVFTIFIFVLLSNWIEIVPGLGTIGIWETHAGKEVLIPFLRSASADLNVTTAIAIISIFTVQIFGVLILGAKHYSQKFFIAPWKKPYGVGTFVGALELFSEISKVISFSFRLFGNIFAGEILLMVMLFLVPYIIPLPFLFLEIFVGFIQALVFSMLTLVFLKMATTAH